MNTFKIALLALSVSAAAASFSTLAAESAVVNVKGSVSPAACSIIVSGNADYGTKTVADLQHAGKLHEGYQLGIKSVPFTIQCTASMPTGVKIIADELGEGATSPVKVLSPTGSGLSATATNTSYVPLKDGDALLGYYSVAIGEFNVDSTPATLIASATGGQSWTSYGSGLGLMSQVGTTLVSWSTGAEAAPTAGQTVTGTVAVSAALIPAAVDAIKDNVSFNTNTTLQLTYL